MADLFNLDGKVALVTGASSGLGAHFARTLAGAGAKVAIGARRIDRLEGLAREITDAGGTALPVAMDVTNAQSVAAAVAAAEDGLGPVGILVNNAGIPSSSRALDMPEEEWDSVLDTNLKGAWLVAREVGNRMVAAGSGGRIVNIASILGITAAKRIQAYSASKAGLISLTQGLAVELARDGILVNAIAPGYVVTELNEEFLHGSAGQNILKRVPLGRFGEASDLDGILLFLSGPASAYTTGAVFVIDGGMTLSTF